MPMMRKAVAEGTFGPSEIALLGRVYDLTKLSGESEAQLENRASRIIALYMSGITDERELVELSRQPLGR